MLQSLRVSSFAVIDEAEVHLGPGLTVLTGETGAGKSILIDALGLLLGGRADPGVIRGGCEEAAVEALFERTPLLASRLAELGLCDLDGEQVSVRRVVSRSGRGKAYVNGGLVSVGVLGKLLGGLVETAGQHEHLGLFKAERHRELVDQLPGIDVPLGAYKEAYGFVKQLDAELLALGGDETQVAMRTDFLRYQLDEIDRLAPEPGEDVRLEEERRRLSSAQKLRRQMSEVEALVAGQENAALDLVVKAQGLLADAAKVDGALSPMVETLGSVRAELDEASRVLSRYLSGCVAHPARLAALEDRLDALKRLCRRHAAPLDGVLAKRAELAGELERLSNRAQLREEIEGRRASALEAAAARAQTLSQARKNAAEKLCARAVKLLAELAMGGTRLSFSLKPKALGADGADELELLCANPGEPQRPLAKVASGGEASRLLLALRQALAEADPCPCYVLDEADAGVGGAVAEAVGRLIHSVSRRRQVLCVTHLPQVAAYADAHLTVRKIQRGGRTCSEVEALPAGSRRATELARMLAGLEVTKEAQGAAQALLRSAQRNRGETQGAARQSTRSLAAEGAVA